MAEIKWFGHACVHLRSREAAVMMDPVPRALGYRFNKQRADIVTISHAHEGHSATEVVSTDFTLIDGPGEYEIKDVFVTGIRTYHDDQRGEELGKNTVYLVEMDGMTICHLGDLGHELTDEQSEAMESVDVLLVPVGGGPALDGASASAVVGQIEPSIVIPIQYRNECGDTDLDGVDRFLTEMAVHDLEPVDKLSIRRSDVADSPSTRVVLLSCSASAR